MTPTARDFGSGGSTTPPRVWVLILNWNGWRDTIQCLESVFASDHPDFAVVVCDNASTDDSLPRIREWAASARRHSPALRIVERTPDDPRAADGEADLVLMATGGNLGFAGGNNVGLRYLLGVADADYIWLLNNDTVVAPSAMSALVARAESNRDLGAVGGILLDFDDRDVVQEAGATYSRWHGMVRTLGAGRPASENLEPSHIDYVTGGCVLLRTAMVRRIGLLDERFFMYGEDIDWGIRMRHAGYDIALATAARVWHKGGGSAEHGSATHDYFNVKSALLLIDKHYPRHLPVAMVYSVYRCLLPKLVRWQWRRLTAVLRAYRDTGRQLRGIHGVDAAGTAPTRITDVVSQPR